MKRLTLATCKRSAVILLGLAGCTGYSAQTLNSEDRAQPTVPKVSQTPAIEVAQLEASDTQTTIELPASIESYERAEIMPYLPGYVGEVLTDIGDDTERGQILVRLDVPEMEAERQRRLQLVAKAQADLASQQAQIARTRAHAAELEARKKTRKSVLDRMANLVQAKALKREKLEEAQYEYDSTLAALERNRADVQAEEAQAVSAGAAVGVAQAELAKADAMMGYLEIKAPFQGVVSERNVDPGDYVRPPAGGKGAMPLLIVESVDRLRVVVMIPIEEAAKVRIGDPVTLNSVHGVSPERLSTVRAAEGQGPPAVSRIAKSLNRRSRMMRAEIDLGNPVDKRTGKRILQPGDYGKISITVEIPPAEVPTAAIEKVGRDTRLN